MKAADLRPGMRLRHATEPDYAELAVTHKQGDYVTLLDQRTGFTVTIDSRDEYYFLESYQVVASPKAVNSNHRVCAKCGGPATLLFTSVSCDGGCR